MVTTNARARVYTSMHISELDLKCFTKDALQGELTPTAYFAQCDVSSFRPSGRTAALHAAQMPKPSAFGMVVLEVSWLLPSATASPLGAYQQSLSRQLLHLWGEEFPLKSPRHRRSQQRGSRWLASGRHHMQQLLPGG